MKITVITAAYNNESTIAHTMKSVKAQTHPEVEHVIIDGGSKDKTVQMVREFGGINFISEPDEGIYDALNKGVKLATGDAIGILGADDYLSDNTVLARVADILKDPKVDVVYGNLNFVDPSDLSKPVRTWISEPYDKTKWLNGWMPPHPTFYIRKSFFDQYGDFIKAFASAGDYEFMLRMCFKHNANCVFLPHLMVTMRTGGTSTASLKNRIRANKEDRLAWKINNLKPKWYTLYLKPLSKVFQFLK